MRVSGFRTTSQISDLPQTYINWCRVLCRHEKIA